MVATARTGRGHSESIGVGDKVKFRFGLKDTVGTIVEIRGPIAKGRRKVYRIEFPVGGDELLATELTADEFRVVN